MSNDYLTRIFCSVLQMSLVMAANPALADIVSGGAVRPLSLLIPSNVITGDFSTTDSFDVGYFAGSVSAGGSVMVNGNNGGSHLTTTGGNVALDPSSTGTVTVDSTVGFGEAQWTDNDYVNIAALANSIGIVNINSATWNTEDVFVGLGVDGMGEVNLTNSATWNNTYLTVGDYGSGVVNVDSSSVVTTAQVNVGNNPGSIGEVNIANGSWVNDLYRVRLGVHSNSVGTMTVQGASASFTQLGSTGIFVGYEGEGTLNILSGGTVTEGSGVGDYIEIGGQGVIGNAPGVGVVNVSGSGSSLVAGHFLRVGIKGTGTLNVSDGGLVNALYPSVGVVNTTVGNGQINVTGVGSTLQTTSMEIGALGSLGANVTISQGGSIDVINVHDFNSLTSINRSGVLNVSGGVFFTQELALGTLENSAGTVNVVGSGSSLVTEDILAVGVVGNGSLNVLQGGQLIINPNGILGTFPTFIGGENGSSIPSATGTARIDGVGSKWTTGGVDYGVPVSFPAIIVGGTAGQSGTGQLTVSNGGIVEIVSQVSRPASYLEIGETGTLSGDGTIIGDVLAIGGTVAPGLSPGILTVDGDFVIESGLLDIEVVGVGSGQYDFLDVSGIVSFNGGTVRFLFRDYLPQAGDSFTFLNAAGGLLSSNVVFEYVGLGDGFEFSVNVGANSFTFTALNNALAPPLTASWLQVGGIVQGGTVFFSVSGVALSVITTSGLTPEQVAQTMADAINNDPILSAMGSTASAVGDTIYIKGAVTDVSTSDAGLIVTQGLGAAPPADGDINLDGVVNVADVLLGTQALSGVTTLTSSQLLHGDVAPLVGSIPAPDGFFTPGDLMVIQRKVLGQINF